MGDEKRTVILFGAGAAIDWGGPCTKHLTSLIRNSGVNEFHTVEGVAITELIYQTLLPYYDTPDDVNFETIISAIDDLIVHHSYHNRKHQTPSSNQALFLSRLEDKLTNFSILGEKENHGYRLNIPKNKKYNYAAPAYNNQSPVQFYLQHLLSELLIVINAEVAKYSILKKEDIKKENENNVNFISWIKNLSKSSIVRMYTLNYDRNFKFIAENTLKKPIFEGFDYPILGDFAEGIPNIPRILTDFDSHIHFNLHGSSFWRVNNENESTNLNDPWISLAPYITYDNSADHPTIQFDKGRNILLSNIITGYAKTQKSHLAPFRQMQSTFDKDCILADKIIIVGYSFGDYHINASISNAVKYNDKIVLHFIDPAYDERNGKDGDKNHIKILINHLQDIFRHERTQPKYSRDRTSYSIFKEKCIVSMVGFAEYLKKPVDYTEIQDWDDNYRRYIVPTKPGQ